MSPAPPTRSSLRFRLASEVATRPIAWLWHCWLAPGELTILEGDPGANKSLLTLDLCARLSTGRPMPDNSPGPEQAGAILVCNEDAQAVTICPRLEAIGANLAQIALLDEDDDDLCGVMDVGSLAAELDDRLARSRARLVVIDPITDFLGPHVSLSSELSVRRALAPLRKLARKHNCAILLVRHLNKEESSKALYRGVGSIAFVAVCRLAWLLAPDPEDPTRCVLAQQKNTHVAKQPSRSFQVQKLGDAQATLAYQGECPLTSDQLLSGSAQRARGHPARARATDFLSEFLQPGPRLSDDVWKAAQEHGLSVRTLNRAKAELGIRTGRVWQGRKCSGYWLLPNQQLPGGQPPDAGPPDLEPFLAPLRAEFPAANPLDESDDL